MSGRPRPTQQNRSARLRAADLAQHTTGRRRKCPRVSQADAKRAYASAAAALRAAAQMKYASTMRAYECRCGMWHLTTVVAR